MTCKQTNKNRCLRTYFARIVNHARPQMSHTLATCSGLWCSTPPWSLKPHGAPPESVMVISSTTMLLCCLLDSGCRSMGREHSLHLYMVPLEKSTHPTATVIFLRRLSVCQPESHKVTLRPCTHSLNWSFVMGRSSKERRRREKVATNVCLHGGILCCWKGGPTLVLSIKPDWWQRCGEGVKYGHITMLKLGSPFLNVMDDRHINTLLPQNCFLRGKTAFELLAQALKVFFFF